MSKRQRAEVLFPEIVDVKIEDAEEDPLEMINEEQFDNPQTRSKLILATSNSKPMARIKKKNECKISLAGSDAAMVDSPIRILMSCALLDLEIYQNAHVFKLKCTHCETNFLLTEWRAFVKHFENVHKDLLASDMMMNAGMVAENQIEMIECLPEVAPISPVNEAENVPIVKPPKIKTERADSDYEDLVDNGDDDNEYEPSETDAQINAAPVHKKPKIKKSKTSDDDDYDDERSSYSKNDKIITFTRTDKEIVLGFLEMLKVHPLLWHRRQSIIQRYDRTLLEMAAQFQAKFPQHTMSTNEMRLSIYRIKKLYEKAVNPPKKDDNSDGGSCGNNSSNSNSDAVFKTKYPIYFQLCKEIEEESKKMAKKCDHCGISFIDEIDLQVHAFQVHRIGELPFKCQRCNRRFANEAKLSYHEKKHHVQHQYACVMCDKTFDKESRLHSHMSLHVGAKQICEICGKSFDSSYRYRRHMLHHAPPQFKCELCGKMLYEKYTLSEHMKTHYNQRNYACEICGKTFNINNGLQIHRRQVHKVKTQYVWGKKAPAPTSEQSQKPIQQPTQQQQQPQQLQQNFTENSMPASNVNISEPASVEMKPSITEQNSLAEAPTINPNIQHTLFQDRLMNDLLSLQQQQQQQQQQQLMLQQQQLQQQQQQHQLLHAENEV